MTTRAKPSSAIVYLLSGILILLFILTLLVGTALIVPASAPLHGVLYPATLDDSRMFQYMTAQAELTLQSGQHDFLSTRTSELLGTKTP